MKNNPLDYYKFKKGDTILFKAIVYTKHKQFPYFLFDFGLNREEIIVKGDTTLQGHPRDLCRRQLSFFVKGLVIGWSTRLTGEYVWGRNDDEYDYPGKLLHTKTHRVLLVEPLNTNQWVEPVAVLPTDCEAS